MRGPVPRKASCRDCSLGAAWFQIKERIRLVPGEGKPGGIMLIGEAPGALELREGKPFVGMSGQLLRASLDRYFDASCIPRYFTNVCLCRPPDNRDPHPEEAECCRERLLEEIAAVKPSLIISFGAIAAESLWSLTRGAGLLPRTKTKGGVKISAVRGRYGKLHLPKKRTGIPIIFAFHPAAFLRAAEGFRDFKRDLTKAAWIFEHKRLPTPPPEVSAIVATSKAQAKRTLIDLQDADHLSCDLETSGFSLAKDRVLTVGVAPSASEGYIFPIELFGAEQRQLLSKLLSGGRDVSGHNIKFDWPWLWRDWGLDILFTFCTMLGSYLLDERPFGPHNLKTMSQERLDAPDYGSEFDETWLKTDRIEEAPRDELYHYQAHDCCYTWSLVQPLKDELEAEGIPSSLMSDLLIPAAKTLGMAEVRGIQVNKPYLRKLGRQLKRDLDTELEELQRIAALSGWKPKKGIEDFNPSSPKQVASVFYDHLGGAEARTEFQKKGGVVVDSTSRTTYFLTGGHGRADFLKGSAKSAPERTTVFTILLALRPLMCLLGQDFVTTLGRFRDISKVNGTYVEPLQEHADKEGRIHCDFVLHGTVTGRLACRNPNLQNIPYVKGQEVRAAFIAQKSWTHVKADYSQLEYRVAAMLSQDEALLDVYRSGRDLHREVASGIFKKAPEEITDRERYIAKFVDFGILYGRGAKSLADGELDCSVEEAQRYVDRFFKTYPMLQRWMAEQRKSVEERGYVESLTGRRRRFPLLTREEAVRASKQCVNAPIQSLASDICLMGAIDCSQELDPADCFLTLMVHDELHFEVKTSALKRALPKIKAIMERERFPNQGLTFEVDIAYGRNWGDAKAWHPK